MSVVCHARLRAGRFVSALLALLSLVSCGSDSPNPTPTTPTSNIVVHLAETVTVIPTEIIAGTSTPEPITDATAIEPTSASPLASSTQATFVGIVKPDASGLRLRERPSADGAIILYLDAGAQLFIGARSTDGIWFRAKTTNGTEGFVMTQFVQLNTDVGLALFDASTTQLTQSTTVSLPTQTPAVVTAATNAIVKPNVFGLRLREQPSNTGKVVLYLDSGVRLRVLEQSADGVWMSVIIPDGTRGFVMSQFVDVSNSLAITPLPSPVAVVNGLKQNLIGSWQLTQDSLSAWPAAPTPQPGVTQIQLIDGLSKQVIFRNDGTFLTFGTGGAQGRYEVLSDQRFVIDLNPASAVAAPATRITYEVAINGNILTLKSSSGRVTTWARP